MDDATETELEPTPPAHAVDTVDTERSGHATTCANCEAPLAGPFCHQCGQEDRDLDRPFVGLLKEWLGGALSFDARLWRTLGPLLFRPGLLTTEYLAGRRARFVPPLRLYFFASIAMFLAIGWSGYSMVHGPNDDNDGSSTQVVAVWTTGGDEEDQPTESQPTESQDAVPATPSPEPLPATDEVTDEVTDEAAPGGTPADETAGATDGEEDAVPLFAKLEHLAENDPDTLNRVFRERLAQALILLTVVFACILWVLFRRSDRYYAHHLIFATHLHAAGFLALSVATLLAIVLRKFQWIGEGNPFTSIVVLAIPFYMFVALRRVHREGRLTTFIKLVLTLGTYLISLVFTMFATLLVAVALV